MEAENHFTFHLLTFFLGSMRARLKQGRAAIASLRRVGLSLCSLGRFRCIAAFALRDTRRGLRLVAVRMGDVCMTGSFFQHWLGTRFRDQAQIDLARIQIDTTDLNLDAISLLIAHSGAFAA
jgi:hypothetical protein